MDSSKKVID